MRAHGAAFFAAVAILAATALSADAAPGDPDPSFGGSGLVTSPSGAARDLVIQPDGKLVAVGEVGGGEFEGSQFRLARYTPDGAPDGGFGASGVVTTPHLAFGLAASDERGEALAIQAGKLLVAGTAFKGDSTGYDFALARYNPDGTLDTGFGSGGAVTTDFATETDWAKAVVIEPDGKIVVAGFAGPGDSDVFSAFALVRYKSDGSLDQGFGSGGKVITPVPGRTDSSIEAVARDALGRIVVAGRSSSDTGASAIALARYSSSGALDGGFGTGGIALTQPAEGDAAANALLIQDGKPVVAGSRSGGTSGAAFMLARYGSSGTLDPSFGSGGLVTTTFGGDSDGANALGRDSFGRLVAAGTTAGAGEDSGPDFALARYDAGGSLDESFGAGGKVVDALGGVDEAQALQLEPDGKPVAAGFSDSFFALTRYKSAAAAGAADVELRIASQPEPVAVGALLSYTITVTNRGPGDAAGIVVTARLGSGSSFDRARSDQGFCTEDGGTVKCRLRALLPGRSTTVTIDVIPNGAGTLTGSAAATTSTPDPSQANNSAAASSRVTAARGSWSAAASFSDGAPRVFHTATVLADGKVLVPGGQGNGFAPLASAQLYGAGRWAPTSEPLDLSRQGHTATLLQGDPSACGANCRKLLVVGGFGTDGSAIGSAELYDPATGAWTPTGDLTTARGRHSATLLPSGKVLVIGGVGPDSGDTGESLAQAELYDPATGEWTAVREMESGREGHSATLLPSGKVLAVGGYKGFAHDNDPSGVLAPPELYDPQLNSWVGAGDHLRRWEHTATLLRDGTVLVVGGNDSNCACPISATELYDPAAGPTGTWRLTRLVKHPRRAHTATLLRDGEVLVTGGLGRRPTPSLRSAELYDPAAGRWSSAGVMSAPRSDHTASLLGDGRVLVAGGSSTQFGAEPLASVELYTPAARPPGPPARDTTAPRVSSFSMLRRRFRVARSPTTTSARRRRIRRGSAFRYTLSEQARVRIAIERRLPGLRLRLRRAARASCRPATRRNRRLLARRLSRTLGRALSERQRTRRLAKLIRRRRCIRHRRAGALTRSARKGRNRTSFSGRIARRALKAGRYRATIRATDQAGNRSRPRRITFRIVRSV